MTSPAPAPVPAPAAAALRRFPWARLVKFGLVGASGVVVNYAVYVPLTRLAHVGGGPSYAAALLLSILSNFLLNELWTFRDRREGGAAGLTRRMAQFYAVSLGGGAINWGVFWACVHLARMLDLVAILVGIAVATAWNFAMNLLWTWRR